MTSLTLRYLTAFIALVVCAVTMWFVIYSEPVLGIEKHARALVATCAPDNPQIRNECYEREGAALYGTLSVPELFDMIRRIRVLDPSYQFCHVLGHRIGELRVLDDPERWIGAIPENPKDSLCSNGFIHGVIIGRFRDDIVSDTEFNAELHNFVAACAPRAGWSPTPLDRGICYHGMGHLFSFITEVDLPRALRMCRIIASGEASQYLRVCQEGVFMQIYQPLEPDDFELLTHLKGGAPTRDTYRKFCARFPQDDERAACLREAVALFREDLRNGIGTDAFCAGHPKGYERACYETAITWIGRTQQTDKDAMSKACLTIKPEWQEECFGRAALAVLEESRVDIEKALDYCEAAPGELVPSCFRFLAERTAYFMDEGGRPAFCASLEARGGTCDVSPYTQPPPNQR